MKLKKLLVGIAALSIATTAVAAPHHRHRRAGARQTNTAQLAPGSVSINTASTAQLEQLKGVGPKRAEMIVIYRKEHGKFKAIEALTGVKGIGPKRLKKIKPYLTL